MDMQPMEKPTRISIYLLILVIVCIGVFITELYALSKVQTITLDGALYTGLAENILKGNGFVFDFVDEFYLKFDSVTHPDEWGVSMMGLLVTPFIYVMGKTTLAPRIPTMLISTIFFPILIYFVGKEFFDNKIGFLSAISMLFYTKTFQLTFEAGRDIPYVFFLLGGIYFYYRALKENEAKYFYLMGLFLGISYLVRQTALIIFPAIVIAHFLIRKKFELNFIKGMLVVLLVMSPQLISNYVHFGSPLYSANKHAAWILGWFPIYGPVWFKVYWGIQKPSLAWMLDIIKSNPGFFEGRVLPKLFNGVWLQLSYLANLGIYGFLGAAVVNMKKIGRKNFIISVLIGLFALLVAWAVSKTSLSVNNLPLYIFSFILYGLIVAVTYFWLAKVDLQLKVFAVVWVLLALFHGLLFWPEQRFFLVLMPFFFIFGWAGLKNFLEMIAEKYSSLKQHTGKIILVVLLIYLILNIPSTVGQFTQKDWNEKYEHQHAKSWIVWGQLLKDTTEEDANVMACNALSLGYYSGRKVVEVPSDQLNRFVEVISWYNVSYLSFYGCERRRVYPEVFYAVFGDANPDPELYTSILFKINPQMKKTENETVFSFNAVPVGQVVNGTRRWTTEHLEKK